MIPMSRISADATDSALDGGRELQALTEAMTLQGTMADKLAEAFGRESAVVDSFADKLEAALSENTAALRARPDPALRANTPTLRDLPRARRVEPPTALPTGRLIPAALPFANRLADVTRVAAPIGTTRTVQPVRVVNFADFPRPTAPIPLANPVKAPAGGKGFADLLGQMAKKEGTAAAGRVVGTDLAAGAAGGPAGLAVAGIAVAAKPVIEELAKFDAAIITFGIDAVSSLAAPFATVKTTVLDAAKTFGAALADPVNGLPALVQKVSTYVQALDPYALVGWNQALRDTQASLGLALTPVITTATAVLRDFGDTLLPVAMQLRGPVQQAMEGLGTALHATVDVFGEFAAALAPYAAAVGSELAALGRALGAFSRGVLIPAVRLASPLVTLAAKMFAAGTAIEVMTKSAIKSGLALATIAGNFFGVDFAGKFIEALSAPTVKADSRGLAAATNPQYAGIGSIGREAVKDLFVSSQLPGGEDPQKAADEAFKAELKALVQKWNIGPDELIRKLAVELMRLIGEARMAAASQIQQQAGAFQSMVEGALARANPFGR